MFWFHDKFGNGLDDPDGSDGPNDLVGLVWSNDLDRQTSWETQTS